MKSFIHLVLAAVIPSLVAPAATAAEATGFIHLEEIDGRSWLVDSQGKPFFAHGITHIGTVKIGAPYEKIAEARIAYGGRGTLSRTQERSYGEDAMDVILPYVAWITLLAFLLDQALAWTSRLAFPWYHANEGDKS